MMYYYVMVRLPTGKEHLPGAKQAHSDVFFHGATPCVEVNFMER